MKHSVDVAIIGGGLAGLAAATHLARRGVHCVVFERSDSLGGRARTDREGGFAMNVGPHALYCNGPAEKVLRALEIPIPGRKVNASNAYGIYRDELHALPGGFVSLLTTDAIDLVGKLELARFMTQLRMLDPKSLRGLSAESWLAQISNEGVRRVITALTRVATYTAALYHLSAEVAAQQLKGAVFDGVSYLDGGWASLIDSLETAAREAGVEIRTGTKVEQIVVEGGRVQGVRIDGDAIAAKAVLIAAGGPDLAAKLSGSATLAEAAERAIPIKAAVLDVALDTRLNPKVKFACGFDRPTYFSVHSDSANVAPPGGSLVSTMLYLAPEEEAGAKAELEAQLDRLQPGWRDHLVKKLHLASITVVHAQVTPKHGLAGRPGVAVPDVDGLFVAGDWVGDSGFLADASLASAMKAAEMIAERTIELAA
jgi:phytoene dehydrogenase-like protein